MQPHAIKNNLQSIDLQILNSFSQLVAKVALIAYVYTTL